MTLPAYRLVLTGASGGLGWAMAQALAEQCEAMVLVGRDADKLGAMESYLSAQHPALGLSIVIGDLTEASTRDRVFAAAEALPGGVNLLINNAGISDFHEFASQSDGAIERQLSVNLMAPVLLTLRLLPLFDGTPRAQIINIGSIFGYLGYPGFAAYCASKFGLRGFSQALRRELADTGIKVRYFAPRAIGTAFNSPAVTAMNSELGNREDSPQRVAVMLQQFLATDAWECKLGFPERLYVFLNQFMPHINDGAIRAQLKIIRKYLPVATRPRKINQKGVAS